MTWIHGKEWFTPVQIVSKSLLRLANRRISGQNAYLSLFQNEEKMCLGLLKTFIYIKNAPVLGVKCVEMLKVACFLSLPDYRRICHRQTDRLLPATGGPVGSGRQTCWQVPPFTP